MTNTYDIFIVMFLGTSLLILFTPKRKKDAHTQTENSPQAKSVQTQTAKKSTKSTEKTTLADYIIVEYCPRL